MDGTEIAEIIRERFNVPVIFLTALNDLDTGTQADRASPVGYLVKPVQEAGPGSQHKLCFREQQRDFQKFKSAGA